MQRLTDQGWQKINEVAQRFGVSTDAAMCLLQALINGNGTMAQFNHWELGGGGQWMQGGMTMVSDLFNHALKAKVDGLCYELSQLLAQQPFVPSPPPPSTQWQGQSQGSGTNYQSSSSYGGGGTTGGMGASLFVPGPQGGSGNWWPADLGSPSGSGAQNNIRYAYFNNTRRLAVDINGQVTVYDTLDNQIGGVSQQQGSGSSLTFTSQYGTIPVASLPIVSINGVPPNAPEPQPWQPQPQPWQPEPPQPQSPSQPQPQEADIFAKIERLADLQQKGIISPDEYSAKKAELLSRL